MAFNYQKHGGDLTKRKALGQSSKLFNSMGEKEYESSLKSIISVSLRKTPLATREHTVVPDKDIELNLAHIPSKSIGASKGDDGRKEYNNTSICSFIVPVSTQRGAKAQSDLIQNWFQDTIKKAIPHIELANKQISWDLYEEHRRSITNHNQNVARQVGGLLDQRNVTGQLRKKIRAELMSKQRMVYTMYTVDVSIMIVHNIYDSFFVKNFKDDKEKVDYFESRTKLYSRNITKRVSIPVSSMEELQKVFEAIKALNFSTNKLEVLDKAKVIELSQAPSDSKFIKSDEILAEELGFSNTTETVESESFDDLQSMFALFHHGSDRSPIVEDDNVKKPDSLS